MTRGKGPRRCRGTTFLDGAGPAEQTGPVFIFDAPAPIVIIPAPSLGYNCSERDDGARRPRGGISGTRTGTMNAWTVHCRRGHLVGRADDLATAVRLAHSHQCEDDVEGAYGCVVAYHGVIVGSGLSGLAAEYERDGLLDMADMTITASTSIAVDEIVAITGSIP